MTYIDGFVIAVPTANKARFIEHATKADPAFRDFGATHVVETWGDNVPRGHTTDFLGAVDAKDDWMPLIAAMPRLRFLGAQDTVAGDDGFVALS